MQRGHAFGDEDADGIRFRIDAMPSGTRRDELLMHPDEYRAVGTLRRALGALDSQQALELLLDKTRDTASNPEFLSQIQRAS